MDREAAELDVDAKPARGDCSISRLQVILILHHLLDLGERFRLVAFDQLALVYAPELRHVLRVGCYHISLVP